MKAKNKKWILLIFGIVEAIVAVVCFSRGLINLFDAERASLPRISVGIGVIVILIVGYVLMSIWYLREPKVGMMDENVDHTYDELYNVLGEYTKGKYFGPIARTVMDVGLPVTSFVSTLYTPGRAFWMLSVKANLLFLSA